jgi:hypothetical protein
MPDIDFITTVDAPIFQRDAKGKIPPTRGNLHKALHRPDICGYVFYWVPLSERFFLAMAWTCSPVGEERKKYRDSYTSGNTFYQLTLNLEEYGFKHIPFSRLSEAIAFYTDTIKGQDSARPQ